LADGKLGIALGISSSVKPDQGNQFQAWGYPNDGANIVLGGTKPYVRSSNLDRDGFMGVVEWKPNDNFSAVVDFYTSDFQEKQLLRGMEIPLYWSSAALQAGYTVTNGYAANATFTNVMPVIRNDVFVRDADPLAFGVNVEMAKKSAWPVTVDFGYSRVNRTDRNTETWSGISHRGTPFTTGDSMVVRINPGSYPTITPAKNYASGSGILLADPQGWGPSSLPGGGMYGYEKYFRAKDELGQLRASTKHELGRWFKSVELGLSYTDRYKRDGEGPSGFLNTNGAVTLPLPATVGTTDFSYLGIGKIYAYDPIAARDSGALRFTANTDVGIVANRYDIREKLTQAYAQFEIDTKWVNTQVTGNLGVRYISTDQESNGFSANAGSLNAVTQGDKYDQLTPTLNLNFHANENTVIRFSAAKQVARPRMYDMRASRSWGYNPAAATSTSLNNSPWSGGGGNGALRPWASNSVDLSFERYFKNSNGYFAIAAFYKKLTNFIYESSAVADFTGYPVNAGPAPALRQGIVTQPVNGQGGSLSGLEATLSLPSEVLNKDIKGFGLIIGGAYTDSGIKPYGPTGPVRPIAGLSRKVANATLYYERHGLSARVSQRYRSESRQYITTFGVPSPAGDVNPNGGFSVAQPETVVDAQVSYTFLSGPLNRLTVFLQAYNLNDEPLITFDGGDPRKVINYQNYGASYSFGASYKF
jgi:iron complex outermembrane receptor protein